MKNMYQKIFSLLLVAVSLTACDFEKRCECLQTSDDLEFAEDMCYQASPNDIVESVFISNPPINPDDPASEYKYDISWYDIIHLDYFKFVDGLSGKHVISIFKVNDQILKITFDGDLLNNDATFGYIRISPSAFRGLTDRAIDAFLYAYIAIGDTTHFVRK